MVSSCKHNIPEIELDFVIPETADRIKTHHTGNGKWHTDLQGTSHRKQRLDFLIHRKWRFDLQDISYRKQRLDFQLKSYGK